jgi:DNA-binding NarL/FixJ family response regulator
MRNPITILLADDHPVYRAGLRQIINEDPAFAVAHETGNGAEALGLLRKHDPRIAILDMDMPGMNGLEVARAHRRERLTGGIVFLTMYREEDMFREAMELGAKGYVLKESAPADILQCLHAVSNGRHYVSPLLSGFLVTQARETEGASREKSRLGILTDKTSKEIADNLGLSPRTVENHRANISAKLGLQGSHSLLKFAFENQGRL